MRKHLILATRGSALALWQANFIKDALIKEYPSLVISFKIIKTQGDKFLNAPLSEVGGKGLFVKEIEETLLDGRADLAVHSMKDVPMELPKELIIGCIPERETPNDCFLSSKFPTLESLPQGALVGTSSLRRQAQLLALRPDLLVTNLRGNIDTRLDKLKRGEYDAIILAAAGLYRLGLTTRYMQVLPLDKFVPAVGQGAMGVECREDNYDLLVMLSSLENRHTRVCVSAERAFLKELNGNCHIPIGGNARMLDEENVVLEGMIAKANGKKIIRSQLAGNASLAEETGKSLALEMLASGGKEILKTYTI